MVVVVGETDVELVVAVEVRPVMLALVAFVEFQVSVADWPEVMEDGEAEIEQVGAGVVVCAVTANDIELLVPFEFCTERL